MDILVCCWLVEALDGATNLHEERFNRNVVIPHGKQKTNRDKTRAGIFHASHFVTAYSLDDLSLWFRCDDHIISFRYKTAEIEIKKSTGKSGVTSILNGNEQKIQILNCFCK